MNIHTQRKDQVNQTLFKDSLVSPKGVLSIKLFDSVTGIVKYDRIVSNIVVDSGKELIASRLVGTTDSVCSHMALGSSNLDLSTSNVALFDEIARVPLSTASYNSNEVTYSAQFDPGVGTGSIVEAGIFNSDGSPTTMLCRTTFLVVNKEIADTLVINWNITFS